MTVCPKCGHQHQQPTTACSKCGLIYEKFRQAEKHRRQEQDLNNRLADTLTQVENTYDQGLYDFEGQRDRQSYPSITYLSWFFFIIAGLTAIAWIVQIMFVSSFIGLFLQVKGSEKFVLILVVAIFSSLPVATYLAIGGALTLGKDIADNTRATRNYLEQLAKRR